MKKLVCSLLIALTFNCHAFDISPEEEQCLATAMYHESRGESDTGKLYVAAVILNRTQDPRFPSDNACGIIRERGQFSFDKRKKVTDWESWNKMIGIIALIQEGIVENLPPFLYFHRIDVVGQCTNKPIRKKKVVGSHVFC